jgi:predicted kinase
VRRYLPKPPSLVLIVGVAGTGKSTLALEILRRCYAVYLDNNFIADAFYPNTRNGPAYKTLRQRFYKALYTITEENLKIGNSVLLDVPHVKEMQSSEWRNFIKGLAQRNKARLIIIRCFCREETLQARLRARGEARDRWKLKHWRQFLTSEPIETPIPFPHLDVNTEKYLSRNISIAIRYIHSRISLRPR